MTVRKRKKKNRMRGHRTHGGGNKKNRRGSGVRGGVGRAGSHKHKFTKYYLDFGTKRTQKAKRKLKAVNLEYISAKMNDWLASGIAKKEGNVIVVDAKAAGFEKVLGGGAIMDGVRVDNAVFTKSAAQKLGIGKAEDEEFEAEEAEGEAEEE